MRRPPSRPLLGAATAAAALLAGCGSSSSGTHRTSNGTTPGISSTTTAAEGGARAAGCRTVSVPAARGAQHLSPPGALLDPHRTYTVTIQTNCGSFSFALDVRHSPKTSASFAALVRRGFFDGLSFHRVVAGFVIQGGDPNGDGSGGPGYTVVEAPPRNTHYAPGDVAMAKTATDPSGSSGSQFFVVTGNASSLPADYALVGHVTGGLPVAQAIGDLPTNPPQDGAPTPAVVMQKVTLSLR